MKNISSKSELLNEIKNSNIAIYGAGYIGELFYRILEYYGLSNRVLFYITTTRSSRKLYNKIIISIDDVIKDDNLLICIATHEIAKGSIEKILIEKKYTNYYWITPYIIPLMLKKEVEKNHIENVRKIVMSNCNDYRIAVKYLTIQQYLNNQKETIYKKMLGVFTSPNMVQRRIDSFHTMIDGWKEHNYKTETPIIIDKDLKILDGTHRVSLAIYYDMEEMICDYYDEVVDINKFHDEITFMGDKTVTKANLTEDEKKLLYNTYSKLIEKYGRNE